MDNMFFSPWTLVLGVAAITKMFGLGTPCPDNPTGPVLQDRSSWRAQAGGRGGSPTAELPLTPGGSRGSSLAQGSGHRTGLSIGTEGL